MHVEVVSTGNKDGISTLFKQGVCDLLVMQSNDTVIDLATEGYAIDPQPFLKSDLIIVGPENDPAGIHGMTDASAAVKKILDSKSAFVVHGSSGADSVVRNIVQAAGLQIDPQQVTVLLNDHQRQVLQVAVDKKAYTLIARVPFKSGKLTAKGYAVMVEGDPRLQKPWLVAIANPTKLHDAHYGAACSLAAFLRSDDTQRWIANFSKGKLDDRSLYFPITTSSELPSTQPTSALLSVVGNVPHPLFLDSDTWKQFPRHEVHVKARDGRRRPTTGVYVTDILKSAGIGLGDHKMNRANLPFYVEIEAADLYKAVFTLPDFDPDYGDRSALLADEHDGQPLTEKEGPLKLIVPQDSQPVRWVRQVRSITVHHAE